MQEKLNDILSHAKGWMTAAQIAEKGSWRSPANVGVALQQIEKANGSVVRRKSPTVKQGNGTPATEWRHADKHFDGEVCVQQKPKSETQRDLSPSCDNQTPVVKDSLTAQMPTDKACCNAAAVVATTAGAEVANLRKQLSSKDELIDSAKRKIAELENAASDLEDDIRRQVQRADAAERNRDDLKKKNADLMIQSSDNHTAMLCAQGDLLTANAELVVAETSVFRWLDLAREYECKSVPELRAFIGALVERVETLRLAKSENVALKILNADMPGFGATHQALCAGPFVVRRAGKPAVFAKKFDNAKAAALSAARQKQSAEVFALVPVGKAVRGAEWKGFAEPS